MLFENIIRKRKNKKIRGKIVKIMNWVKTSKPFKVNPILRIILWVLLLCFWILWIFTPIPLWIVFFWAWIAFIFWIKTAKSYMLRFINVLNYIYHKYFKKDIK